MGMSNQKSKFHTSSCFGNRLLASCHLASCQANSLPSGEVLAAQIHGSRSDGSGLQHGANATAAQCSTAHSTCLFCLGCSSGDASEQLLGRHFTMICPASSFVSQFLYQLILVIEPFMSIYKYLFLAFISFSLLCHLLDVQKLLSYQKIVICYIYSSIRYQLIWTWFLSLINGSYNCHQKLLFLLIKVEK